jgi:PTS system nitrogen regulatory IIA component
VHLKALARISKLLKSPEVRSRLLSAPDAEALFGIINAEEEKL